MKNRSFSILRWISLIFIFVAALVTILQLVSYSRIRANFPRGLTIANVPVGGIDQAQASERVLQAYAIPIEIRYADAILQVKPSAIGFELDLESMLSAAELQRINQPFWQGFWDYLWNRTQAVTPIPLRASIVEERLRSFLMNEIAVRYDQPPTPAEPVPGSVNFKAGQPGTTLDIDRAVELISDSLYSPNNRVVNLTFGSTSPPRPSINNLQILLKQIIDLSKFTGVTELYLKDLHSGQKIHFTYQIGQKTSLPVDIAFSSWSTIKIPVMVSAFRRLKDPEPLDALALMQSMIQRSDNDSTDKLAMTVIDPNLAPLLVTDDMRTLGLEDTYWAGFFYTGAPLLRKITTPANQRIDINTGPDIYGQTTPADLGILLEDIYMCSEKGGGALVAAFPGEITQDKCKQMINYLEMDKIAVLIQAGLPGGVQLAHKHGWAMETNDSLIHTMGDAGIIYSPSSNYILAIFVYDPIQVVWEPVNQMVSELSRAVYNFFNLPVK